jgi:hypothetical protein
MRIALTRSGGFAGITQHREIDTAQLAPADRSDIERLVARAQAESPSRDGSPDAFEYEITIDGHRYVTSDAAGAWRELIEGLQR